MKQLFPPNAQLAHASVIAYFQHWLLNCLLDDFILFLQCMHKNLLQ